MTSCQKQDLLINRVLKDLQGRSIVSPRRRLTHMKEKPARHPSFYVRAVRLGHPIIAYRFGNCTFDEGGLRFILMHEEKHIRSPLSWLIPTILISADMYLLLWLLSRTTAAEAFLFSFVMFLAIWYGSMPLLRYGEAKADIWSAQKLKSEFGIHTPSEVALKALSWPDVVECRVRKVVKSLSVGPIHPSRAQRVARIVGEVDERPGIQESER